MKKILVIDDDRGIVDALTAMLEYAGYSVSDVSDLNKLSNKLNEFKPNLILLDLLLSGKDGGTVARELRADNRVKDVPIIILSAHPSAAKAAQSAGATDFLAKPFEMDDLLGKINKYIK